VRQQQTIETILFSFRRYAMGDVIHNRKKAISGFILGVCVIDQLACFYYKGKSTNEQWEEFVAKFMPIYAGKGIFKVFRNNLVHNYCGASRFALCYDLNFPLPIGEMNGKWVISTHIFIQHLIKAFRECEKEMLDVNSKPYDNAREWSERHPVLTDTTIEEDIKE
jgi:hypothetical protein